MAHMMRRVRLNMYRAEEEIDDEEGQKDEE